MDSLVMLGVSAAATTPTDFTASGFEALVSYDGTLDCMACLTPPLFLPAYQQVNVETPGPPATTFSSILRVLGSHLHPTYQSR